MFLKQPAPKYKHLYAKPTKLSWFSRSSIISKLMLVFILGLIVAVVWLGGATFNWKIDKKKYRERIRVLRAENESLRVEKDLMITRMTIAGLLKPVQDGTYEYNDENLAYYTENNEEDIGYSEMVSFADFGGSYNAKNNQVKITFRINNAADGVDKIEGRVFVVLAGEELAASQYILMPNDSKLLEDGRPDGAQGGGTFSMREFKDMVFTGMVPSGESAKYDTGIIYIFTKDGEFVQFWELELDLSKADKIVLTEVE